MISEIQIKVGEDGIEVIAVEADEPEVNGAEVLGLLHLAAAEVVKVIEEDGL